MSPPEFTRHLMCEHCWYATPGNVLYNPLQHPHAVFPPLLKMRVKGGGIQVCCLCGSPTSAGISFEEDAEELTCIHDPDGSLPRLPALYRRRAVGWATEETDYDEETAQALYGARGSG